MQVGSASRYPRAGRRRVSSSPGRQRSQPRRTVGYNEPVDGTGTHSNLESIRYDAKRESGHNRRYFAARKGQLTCLYVHRMRDEQESLVRDCEPAAAAFKIAEVVRIAGMDQPLTGLQRQVLERRYNIGAEEESGDAGECAAACHITSAIFIA